MADRSHLQRTYLRDLAGWARREDVTPTAAVAGLAHLAARAETWPAAARGAIERLNSESTLPSPPPPPGQIRLGPWLLGQVYEALLDGTTRRARGAYFTPPLVARRLLDVTLEAPAGAPQLIPDGPVLDPAVGGGAFLLAAAAKLAATPTATPAVRATSPTDIVTHRLRGADLDPVAVAVTRLALAWWAWRNEGRPSDGWPLDAGRNVVVADALLDDRCWPEADPFRPGVVVGNPPFLGQLSRRTARSAATSARLADLLGPASRGYVDGAALFLLAACRRRPAGCRIGLILPESVLVTAHCEDVRREVLRCGRLLGLWLGGDDVFGGAVRVCAPIIELGAGPPEAGPIRSWRGAAVEPSADLPTATAAALHDAPTWGPLTAPLRGAPHVRIRPTGTTAGRAAGPGRIADLARATAGFRDQFYGLRPHVHDHSAPNDQLSPRTAPLVTAGLIDPALCRWGQAEARFAGRRFAAPLVDLDSLAAADAKLASWVSARLRPKLLVATQGKVLEAVADQVGRLVPSVPVIAVEPQDPGDLWRILAVLCSPVAAAWALERYGGAGLSGQSIKLSARQVLTVPTPADIAAWDGAAASCRAASETLQPGRRRRHLRAAAARICEAYGVPDPDATGLVQWWERRVRWEDPEILGPSP